MADDYYQTLGVKRDATPEQIQKAYRDLARKYHPDLHPDDKTAKEKFQQVQAAFDVLNDPEKRTKYDRFGSAYDSAGAGGARGPFRWESSGDNPGGGFENMDLGDLFGGGGGGGFADLFKGFRGGGGAKPGGPRGGARQPRRGPDLAYELQVPLNTAVLGGEASVTIEREDGEQETLSVKIPAGIEDGKKIRLRGQGGSGGKGGEAGDILITIRVAAHPHFQRRGKRLDVEVPVSLAEAALGAKIDVPTPHGTITLSIPPGTPSGKRLRIKGQGVQPKGEEAGDLYAEIQIVLPDDLDVEDLNAIKKIDKKHPGNPRADLQW